jgi:hypothetical protein
MKPTYRAIFGIAFAGAYSIAAEAHFIYCRADTVHSDSTKTWCAFSSTWSEACDNDTTMGTIDNAWLKDKKTMPDKCPVTSLNPKGGQQVIRWTQPDKSPEPEPKK